MVMLWDLQPDKMPAWIGALVDEMGQGLPPLSQGGSEL